MAAGEQQGREYLERYKIPELLHNLSALLLYHRPADIATWENIQYQKSIPQGIDQNKYLQLG
ncbi:zinc fingers and homeoboxes protein 3 [Platysternon megacephalum]|uniref:Zinc fingers and homeoboxes protein 3 n=1 Tax=Platysternon megacephalum TaxID=55544 RepID=A0A4D9E9Y9_9SAUR|nr:zinc fingers and homeoboxes protein 3 [Platysternon megacephalum]